MLRRDHCLVLPILVAALAGCSGGDLAPLVLDPASHDFGLSSLNVEQKFVVTVRNPSSKEVNLGIIASDTFEPDFGFESMGLPNIAPGGMLLITVTFLPTTEGLKSGQLTLLDRKTGAEYELSFSGTGLAEGLTADNAQIDFGRVVFDERQTRQFTLTNLSSSEATLETTVLDNVRPCADQRNAAFCLRLPSEGTTAKIPANGSLTVDVEFVPPPGILREVGLLTFSTCTTANCKVDVQLEGAGIDHGLDCDNEVDFGQVTPGTCSTRNANCTNLANNNLDVQSWRLSAESTNFQLAGTQGRVLTGGESLAIEVTYCPQSATADRGAVLVQADGLDMPRGISLLGTGGGPDIRVFPEAIDFGLATLIAPTERTFIISNVGSVALTVNEVNVDADATGSFRRTDGTGPLTIEPGTAATVVVEFSPFTEGVITSSIELRSNDTDQPTKILTLRGEGINLPPCQYAVSGPTLDFGDVDTNRRLERSVFVHNTGPSDCVVGAAFLSGGSDPSFSTPSTGVVTHLVPRGEAIRFDVEFAPTSLGGAAGSLGFSVSDPANPRATVDLVGNGADGPLFAGPGLIDFGISNPSCGTSTLTVRTYNRSDQSLTITNIQLEPGSHSAFSAESIVTPPMQLEANASFDVAITYDAAAVRESEGALVIEGSDRTSSFKKVVPLRAVASVAAEVQDVFIPHLAKVDILFVVDGSNLIDEEQMELGRSFVDFVTFARAENIDYQVGVISADTQPNAARGRLLPLNPATADERIITEASTPSPEAIFADRVLLGRSIPGREYFEATELALTEPNASGHNAGFLRSDARLAVVFMTDDFDSSDQTLGYYEDLFDSMKGSQHRQDLSLSAIAGPSPSGCNGPGGSAGGAPRINGISERTVGVQAPVCSLDWLAVHDHLAHFGRGGHNRLFLTSNPDAGSLQVEVDQVVIPATGTSSSVNWRYNADLRSVDFTPEALPDPSAEIIVRYAPQCLN